jgi:hypothetical protein
VPLVASAREPFARIGRDFKLATDDVMSFTYVSLPAGARLAAGFCYAFASTVFCWRGGGQSFCCR